MTPPLARLLAPLVAAAVVCAFSVGSAHADEPAPAPTAAPAPVMLEVDAVGSRQQTVTVGSAVGDHVGATCETPCRLSIAPGSYVLTGKARGVLSTRATVVVPHEDTRVTLRGDRKAARVWGIVLTSFGGAATVLGGLMLGAVLTSGVDDSYNRFAAVLSGGIVATGLATGIPGLFLLLNNHGGIDSQSPAAAHRPRAFGATVDFRF